MFVIIGGSGYIGSHLIGALNKKGDVMSIDNYDNSFPWTLGMKGQSEVQTSTEYDFKSTSPLIACVCTVNASNTEGRDCIYTVENAIACLARTFEIALANGCERVIYVSSLSPTNANLACEAFCKEFAGEHPLMKIIVCRLGEVFGGDHPMKGPYNIISECRYAFEQKKTFLLQTSPEGPIVRDFIHVADVTNALIFAMTSPKIPTGYTSVEIGTGQGTFVELVVKGFKDRNPSFQVEVRQANIPQIAVLTNPSFFELAGVKITNHISTFQF